LAIALVVPKRLCVEFCTRVRSVFVTLDCSVGEVHRLPCCSLAACVYILATLLGLEGRLVLASLASIRARRESEHTTTVLATPLRYNFLLGGLRVLLRG
jgi:hypothetical protein